MRWWEELEGPLLGRYRVHSLIGRGGMAEVLLAHDERLSGKRVAVKAPALDSFAPAQLAELLLRFQREVQRQGSDSISGVVPILDAGEIMDGRGNSQPFLVMEYLAGGSLGDRLGGASGRRERTQTLGEVIEWLRPVATTLDRLHARKYLHRDVKPDNILFNADGDPLLADFGIATSLDEVAAAGTMMSVIGSAGPGSPGYQSPESLRGDKLAASDQFSLAVTAYESLAGRLPMEATTRDAWIGALANWKPTPLAELRPDLPHAASDVLLRAMSAAPRDRFLSCAQFAQALSDVISAAAPTVRPAPAATSRTGDGSLPTQAGLKPSTPVRSRFRWAAWLGLVGLLGLCGVVWWAVYPELRNDALREDDSRLSKEETATADALIIEAHSFGPEADAREITEAALNTYKLERVFNAADQLARIHAQDAEATPANDSARARAVESSLDAARKGRIASESAQALTALGSNWLDNYRERGSSLLVYALDVARRAAEFARNPPSAALGNAPGKRFTKLADESEAIRRRIATEIARRKQLGNVADAAGPAGAFELETRVANTGLFRAPYAENRRRAEDTTSDVERCDNEDELRPGERGRLQHVYYSVCMESRRTFVTSMDFESPRPLSKDSMSFTSVTTEVRCVNGVDKECPGFKFDQPQEIPGSLELVTDDLMLVSLGHDDAAQGARYFLMQRVQDKPVEAVARKPVAATKVLSPEASPVATKPPARKPPPAKPRPGSAADVMRQLKGLEGLTLDSQDKSGQTTTQEPTDTQ